VDVTFSTGWQVPLVDAMDYGITITTQLVGDGVPANDTLVDTMSSMCLWIEDVAPVLIVWPEDTVYCSSSGDPTAKVTNLGQISATFDVVFSIDTSGVNLYEDTVNVVDLAPAETTDAVFGSWTVPDVDGINYDLTVWTMLPGDVDMSNDTLGGASWGMCLPWEDVYPSWVVWPGDTVLCDSSDTVRVKVVNAGGLDASFDVVIQIDTNMTVIWSDTATVTNLLPGDSADAVFDEWTVPDLDSTTYGITSWTLLASDSLPANDTLVTSTFGYCFRVHDVGILGRVAPPDTVLCEQIYSVMVDVMNYGDFLEDFDVICTIEDTGGITIHQDTMIVLGLDPDSSRTATFASSWTVPNVDSTHYSVTFYSELAGDFNATNDTVSDSIFGYCELVVVRDVGPVIILNPPDTVFCDSTVVVSAWVKNFGTEQEFFNVECIMDTTLPVYADTQAVLELDPGDSVIVNFLNWPVPGADSINYTMTVTTLLAADTIYSNDTLAKPVFGYCALIHDCGIDSIDAPPDTVAIDSTYTPRVSVHNWGDYAETFDIICTIDGYDDTVQVVDLLPGVSTDIPFAPWSTSMPGSYLMSVVIELTDDGNAENDTASKTIEAVTGIYDQYVLPRVPLESGLLQNAPNPLSVYTHIYYQVAASGEASLNVYDLVGRLVKVLFEGFVEPGYYSARWEGDDETGNPVPSGIYIYKLRIGKEEASKKLVVVR
ncbi:T9SS type A sorting domain-containing protein, partial [candidate division TA06 bacterium]